MLKSSVRRDRTFAIAEVIVFVIAAIVLKRLLDPVIWRFSGPVSLVMILVAMTLYWRIRGLSWRELGLIRLPGWRAKLRLVPQTLLTFLAFAAAVGTTLIAAELFDLAFMSERPAGADERWGDIEGNLPLYLLWLSIVWTAAAFGEEMFFRGFLVSRLMIAFGSTRIAAVAAVLVAAFIFGYAHFYYQGWRGFITTGAIGIAFGAMFLLLKRNLYPLIIMHGIVDTLTFSAIYFGWED